MTAQVEHCWRDGLVTLIVLKCEITQNAYGMELVPFKEGETMRRKRSTLAGAERRMEPEPPKVRSRFLS